MTAAKVLVDPVQTLEPRLAIADFEKSAWDCYHTLCNGGLQWQAWIPPSQRRKKDKAIADGYSPDAAKEFYSTIRGNLLSLTCVL